MDVVLEGNGIMLGNHQGGQNDRKIVEDMLQESIKLDNITTKQIKEDSAHYKKFGMMLQYFLWRTRKEGQKMRNCPVCTQQESVTKRWQHCQRVDLIKENRRPSCGHYTKQPCYAMYDAMILQDHLDSRDKCIYHKIISGYFTPMNNLREDHGLKLWLSMHSHARTSFSKVCVCVLGSRWALLGPRVLPRAAPLSPWS